MDSLTAQPSNLARRGKPPRRLPDNRALGPLGPPHLWPLGMFEWLPPRIRKAGQVPVPVVRTPERRRVMRAPQNQGRPGKSPRRLPDNRARGPVGAPYLWPLGMFEWLPP